MKICEDRVDFIREALPRGGRGAELGVWQGDHALQLLEYAQPEHLWLIDAWSREYEPGVRAEYLEQVYAHVKALFHGDDRVTIWRARTDEGVARLEDGSLDWIYVDASHGFEAVYRDLQVCWPKLKPGGVLAGHDYHQEYPQFGVIRAVDTFLADHGLSLDFKSKEIYVDWAVKVPGLVRHAEEPESVEDCHGSVQEDGSFELQEGRQGSGLSE